MVKKVSLSPVTRLSGLLSLDVFVEEGVVVNAQVRGEQFRGLEWMLAGREIMDAPYFTERICGICSLAHGVVSSNLVDLLYENVIPPRTQQLRNVMLGLEFLQNHIRHFYIFLLPDYIVLPPGLPYQGPVTDRRFDRRTNDLLVEHYQAAFLMAAKAHEAQTIFGGKAPHQHALLPGGVTVPPTADRLSHSAALASEVLSFIRDVMVPDTELLAATYSDYFHVGRRPATLISYGLFDLPGGRGTLWPAGRYVEGCREPEVNVCRIGEDVVNAWYTTSDGPVLPPDALVPPDVHKEGAYTFVKAVHYDGVTYECGPLARCVLRRGWAGETTSTMDRIVARTTEAHGIAVLVYDWLKELTPGPLEYSRNRTPRRQRAYSLHDAPRGALLHSAELQGTTIQRYGVITPTVWNFSPRNYLGIPGPVEQTLIGTRIDDLANPVELGRIIRAFDPCLSCGTHVVELKRS